MVDQGIEEAFVRRSAEYFAAEFGLAPITARVLSWLMVCEPDEQAGPEIAVAVGASRASITTSLRLLQATGLVGRRRRLGDRTVYYAIDDDAWRAVIQRRIESMTTFVEFADDAAGRLERLGRSAARIRSAQQVFSWLADAGSAAQRKAKPKEKRA